MLTSMTFVTFALLRIVIQHHKSDKAVSCAGCEVPRQGADVGSP